MFLLPFSDNLGMIDFWERVKYLLKERKKSQEWLADTISTPKFTLYGWIKNDTIPPANMAVRIAITLETTVEELIEGKKQPRDIQAEIVIDKMEKYIEDAYRSIKYLVHTYRTSTDPIYNNSLESSSLDVKETEPAYGYFFLNDEEFRGEDMIVLPILGKTAAGMPIDAHETIQIPRRLLRGNETDFFCLQIEGYSMTEVGIDDGDHVILRRTEVPENGRIMLVQHEGKTTLKKLKIRNGITYLCWEDGSNHEPIVVDSDGFIVQGELVHIIKTL
jgi:SOS-response transcriptional repressor LexA